MNRITALDLIDGKAMSKYGKIRLDAYPRLTCDVIQAALGFAAEALRADVVYPFVKTA
jgi:uncharacterized protein (DUF433 family)